MTKFVGNTECIINSIPDDHRAEKVKNLALGQDKLPIERALGVIWCVASDKFNFRIELKDKPCRHRGILLMISSIYDPLGFIAPVVLVGKKILRDICHSNSWDEPVDDSTTSRWEKWRNELCLLESLKVPRVWKDCVCSASLYVRCFNVGVWTVLIFGTRRRKRESTCVVCYGKGPCNTEEDSQHPEVGIGCCHDFSQYW